MLVANLETLNTRIWVYLILSSSIWLTEVELTSTTTRAESISTKSGIVQQESACSRLALLRPWRVRVESGRPLYRWSKRYTGRYTTRPHEKCLYYSTKMRLSKGRAWWSWSNAGWLFRSRGHGSMSRSRNLVAGGRDVNPPKALATMALPKKLCVTRNRAACLPRRDDGILCILLVTGVRPKMATALQGPVLPSQSGVSQRRGSGLGRTGDGRL